MKYVACFMGLSCLAAGFLFIQIAKESAEESVFEWFGGFLCALGGAFIMGGTMIP